MSTEVTSEIRPRFNQLKATLAAHRGLLLILLVYLLLSLTYNAATPIFEAPDEATHYRYIKYLRDHHALPALIDGPNRDELWGLHQPPLYFLFAAFLTGPVDHLVAPDDFLERNPHVNLGFATRPGNKNVFIHTPAERFPYQGLPLLVRLLRLFSMTLGGLTLVIVYLSGLELFAGRNFLALLAPGLMALHPEFVFINTSIANEPLNILLMAAGLWGALRLIKEGPSLRLALFLGIVTGMIAITKMTGLALILVIVVAMLIAAFRDHSALKLWQFGIVVAGLIFLTGGWWYLRNLFLYGDPWQAGMYRDFYSDTQQSMSLRDWLTGLQAGEVSFWATFGWFNILTPEWVYTFYRGLLRLGLVGLLVFLGRWLWQIFGRRSVSLLPDPPSQVLLLLASPLISSLILVRLMATEGGIQGRQLLPMLPALALLLVVGYRSLLPRRWFGWGAAAIGATMAILAVTIPFWVITPAYSPPPLLSQDELPAEMIPLSRRYGGRIELLGYHLDQMVIRPGMVNGLTLYWRALEPLDQDYTVFVHALGRELTKVGEYNGYPGRGTLPTSRWPVGPIVADRYEFQISPFAVAPTLLRLNVGFFDHRRLDLPPLPTTDAQGNPVDSQLAQQILLPSADQSPAVAHCTTVEVHFADNIILDCYDYRPALLLLQWTATAPPQADYTVFIQLLQDGQQVAGFDGPPFGNDFPTSYWLPDLTLPDRHPLDLSQAPPGDYRLVVGLYDPQTGERLPAYDRAGEPLPDYAVDLGVITVEQAIE